MDNLETIKTEISKFKNQSIDAVSIYNNRTEMEQKIMMFYHLQMVTILEL